MADYVKNRYAVAALFCTVGFLVYLSGLNAPWYFDDYPNIVNNPLVADPGRAFAGILKPRGVVIFSFAVNNALTGLDPLWFRLVNILLHIGAALLVWRILTRIYGDAFIALFGGLLFLVHPLQTQAVTYVVQRMALLSACFFLLSVYLYLRGRDAAAREQGKPFRWVTAALLCAVLSIWSKQSAIFLPLILLFADYAVVDQQTFSLSSSLRRTAPFFLVSAAAVLQQFLTADMAGELTVKAQVVYMDVAANAGTSGVQGAPPLRYLATELIAFWVYIKLFFLPIGQALDYSWRMVEQIFNGATLAATIGFVLIFSAITYFRLWTRRLIFGLAWIVLTLALESSFIPLDPIYEHRMYLPFLGAFMVVQELLFSRIPWKAGSWVALCVLLVFSGLTVRRNAQWSDPVELWGDNARRIPGSARIMVNLAKAYQSRGDKVQAQHWHEQAMTLNAKEARELTKLGMSALQRSETEKAQHFFDRALQLNSNDPLANSFLGGIYLKAGQEGFGLALLKKAVQLAPESQICLQNLAVAYELVGRKIEAESIYRQAVALNPQNASMLLGLGVLLDETKRSAAGLEMLQRAQAAAPDDAKILFYLGVVALHAGDNGTYQMALGRLQQRDRNYYEKLSAYVRPR